MHDWSPTREGAQKILREDLPVRLARLGLEADAAAIVDPDGFVLTDGKLVE